MYILTDILSQIALKTLEISLKYIIDFCVDFYNKTLEYLPYFMVAIIISIMLFVAYKYFFAKHKIRDKEYIKSIMRTDCPLLPMSSRKEILKRYTGKNSSKEEKKLVNNYIDSNICQIINFLDDKSVDGYNVLCINSKWGTGKTTSLLVAIDEAKNENNRYIYESPFKYNGLNEFYNDLLYALNDTMQEIGIDTKDKMDSLINNLDTSVGKTILNVIKRKPNNKKLSSELIEEINSKIASCNENSHTIFIIIDDLDRIKGDEIYEILSLLSVLRRIKCIKMVILADSNILVKALSNFDIIEPELFVQKYLPEQSTISLKSFYRSVEMVALRKVYKEQKHLENINSVEPAYEALLIKLIADILKRDTRDWNISRKIYWLSSDNHNALSNISGRESMILGAPRFIHNMNNNIGDSYGASRVKYDWNISYDDPRRFEYIILGLVRTGNKQRVTNNFTDDDYLEVVHSWVIPYVERRWGDLGVTIRDIIDISEIIKNVKLSNKPGEQFAQVFNTFFDKKINYFNVSEEADKKSNTK